MIQVDRLSVKEPVHRFSGIHLLRSMLFDGSHHRFVIGVNDKYHEPRHFARAGRSCLVIVRPRALQTLRAPRAPFQEKGPQRHAAAQEDFETPDGSAGAQKLPRTPMVK